MNGYKLTLQPTAAFGTPLVGDSLFGQLCWAIRNRFGEAKLTDLLQGYTENHPFMVVSDAFPHDHLPLPHLPSRFWAKGTERDHKKLKKKQWVPLQYVDKQTALWQQYAKSEGELSVTQDKYKLISEQPHNSINRMTSTTGDGGFAPYSMSQTWYCHQAKLDIYVLLDEVRFSIDELMLAFQDIAQLGFGRDASIGLGRFQIIEQQPHIWKKTAGANAFLALANAAPQQQNLNATRSFYQITTRFGRHGDLAVFNGNPFKKPLILTKAGAVFTPHEWQACTFLGNGLSNVSYAMPETVHQGYAPVVPLCIDFSVME